VRTAAMFFLVILGIVTLPAVPWLGVPMVGYGIYMGSRADHEDVSRFVGALFALGVIGFVAAFFVGSKET
jgi:xanthine/uracil permease